MILRMTALIGMMIFYCQLALAQTPILKLKKPATSTDQEVDFTGAFYGNGFFGDHDADGDLDFIGSANPVSSTRRFYVQENDGNGNFSAVQKASFHSGFINIQTWVENPYALGDFNGDDYQDLLAIKGSGLHDSTKLYFGAADGSLTYSGIQLMSCLEGEMIVEDVDSDGDLDVFLAGKGRIALELSYTHKTILYLNDGDGNFTVAFEAESTNDVEIAITEPFSGTKRNLFIRGPIDGSFQTLLYHYDGAGNFSFIDGGITDATGTEHELHVADINGDGIGDLLNESANNGLNFFVSTGETSYDHLTTSNMHQHGKNDLPQEALFSDLNLDGYADLIYSSGYNGSSVYHGDGSGDFTLVEYFPDMEFMNSYTIGDITGDGYPEFMELGTMTLTEDSDGEVIQLYINEGDGTFIAEKNTSLKNVYNGMIGMADIDDDCDKDILVFGTQHENETEGDLYLQDASGEFINVASVNLGLSGPSLLADLDNDGSTEILSGGKVYEYDGSGITQNTNYSFASIDKGVIYQFDANGDNALDILISGSGMTALYINYGDGSFEELKNIGISGFSNTAVASGDLDNDGDDDLMISGTLNNDEITTRLYLNNGYGYFTQSVETVLPAITNGGVSLAYLDTDEWLDIVFAGNGVFATYLNDGTGKSFTENQTFDGLSNASVKTFDIDYDGDMDFIASGFSEEIQWAKTQLFLNDGSGNFSASEVNLRGMENAFMTFEDMDDDYDADLLITGSEESKNYWYGLISRIYENTVSTSVINTAVTVCDSYCFRGATLTTSGSYSESFTTAEGETRTVNLELTVAGSYDETVNITADGSYRFNGKVLRESGTYAATLTSSQGCDSLVTLNLTINDHVDPSDVEQIVYHLIQPDGTPQVQADFKETRYGSSVIYDMDGDGDNDYLVIGRTVNGKAEFISYLNEADGSFVRKDQPGLSISSSSAVPIILHGDLNGDAIEDIIVSGERYDGVDAEDLGTNVYFGDATGSLTLQSDISIKSPVYGFIDLADLTGDGVLDILVAHYSDGTFLYTNDGSGVFTETTPTGIGFNYYAWDAEVSESYNGGTKDILIGTVDSGFNPIHQLYRFDGSNFSLISENITGAEGSKAYFADANNDSAPDILVGTSSSVKIYLNDGLGTYAQNTSETFSNIKNYNSLLRFVDLNNDNAAEVIFDKYNSTNVFVVFWNDGSGNFPTNTQYGSSNLVYSSVAIGDLTGDTYPDIYYSGHNTYGNKLWETGGFINNQSNDFDKIVYGKVDNIQNGATQYADVDGDGDVDLITSGKSYELGAVSSIYLNDGTGEFTAVGNHALDSVEYASLDLADIDGNMTNDLVISGVHRTGKLITKIYNNTAGAFSENTSIVMDSVANGVVRFFHANNDTNLDILSIGEDKNGDIQAYVYLGDGTGGFTSITSGLEGLSNAEIAIKDLNGDDFEDILMVGQNDVNDHVVRFYTANGDATFTLNTSNAFIGASDVQIADIDGDGIADIYLAGVSVQAIYLNDGMGNFSLHTYLEQVSNSKTQFDDVDLDGDQDFVVAGDWIDDPVGERTYLYVNDGFANFTRTGSNILHDVQSGSMHLADVDGDLDLDMVLSGTVDGTTSATRIYRNVTCAPDNVVLDPVTTSGSYEFYGQTITSSGTYTHSFTSVDGCFRTLQIDVTISNDYHWSGTTDTDWFVATNWEEGTVPGADDNAFIQASANDPIISGDITINDLSLETGTALTISAGNTLDVTGDLDNLGDFVVESGASLLTYEVNQFTGNDITFSRNTRYSDYRYSMVGSPVKSRAGLTGADLGPIVYTYDETVAFNDGTEDGLYRWTNAQSESLQPGVGYAAAGQQLISIAGEPNNGSIEFTGLTRSEDATTTQDNWGWHLVSNPYPAALDLAEFIAGNSGIQGSIALWDDHGSDTGRGTSADYLIANAIGTVSGPNGGQFEGYIGSMQGFMVQVGAGQTGDLVFTEDMRVTGNNEDATFFRTSEESLPTIRLIMKDTEGHYSETLIGFSEDATVGVDRLYDAVKLKGNNDHNIYSLINGLPYAIQGLPAGYTSSIPLGVQLNESGVIEFSMEITGDFSCPIQLLDKQTNEIYDLSKSVSLTLENGAHMGRFELVMASNILSDLHPQTLLIYTGADEIKLHYSDYQQINELSLISLEGRLIDTVSTEDAIGHLNRPKQTGVYIIQVVKSSGEVETTKIFID